MPRGRAAGLKACKNCGHGIAIHHIVAVEADIAARAIIRDATAQTMRSHRLKSELTD